MKPNHSDLGDNKTWTQTIQPDYYHLPANNSDMCNSILHKLLSSESYRVSFVHASKILIFHCLLGQTTYFEAAVTVNLTSLLCITALFVSVNDSLPKTADLKLVDIW